MKCQGFWWLAADLPHKYIIEFNKKEVEELLAIRDYSEFEYFGRAVWDILVAEYETHNKGIDK